MELSSKTTIKKLLKKYQLFPSKKLGQNFLINKRVVRKIIKMANLQWEETILEIGPGLGVLTQELAKKTKQVIAVEKDPKMKEILKETLKNFKNIKIINKDILKIKIKGLKTGQPYKIVANLPYYIVGPVIRKFLESSSPPQEMILMVQKEVAQRICSSPPKMNLLAVAVQFYARGKILFSVPKKSFWPQPKVGGAIIKIIPHQKYNKLKSEEKNLFFKIVKAGFSQPRKQLINNLAKELKINKKEVNIWLQKSNLQPTQRAETLTIEDWLRLSQTF